MTKKRLLYNRFHKCWKRYRVAVSLSVAAVTVASAEALPLSTPNSLRTKPVIEKKNLRPVKGRVQDTNGDPLPGVSIVVKGTQSGTTTNAEGDFELNISSNEAVLIVSYIGYKTQEVAVGAQAILSISLEISESALQEVVVVGYGTQKKATVTGAIASVQTREIKQSPAANLAVTLAGRLPGLTSVQTSGEPGRDITQLFIRGRGTVNAQSPIILVDGVERDLTYIDPNEVESVTILKDASSTAIFGVRGANGVILVTTKRGTSEKPEISFSVEAGAQDFVRFIKPVNSYEFASLRNLAQRNDGLAESYSPEALEHYRLQDDPLRYPDTKWRDILIKDFSMQQRYNLNVSGAGKAMKYFVNAGYLNQGGQYKVEKNLPYDPSFRLDRYNFRSNIDLQLTSTLKAFLNVGGYLEKQNMPMSILNRVSGDFNGNLASMSPALYLIALMTDLPATIPGPLTPDGEVTTGPSVDWPAYGLMNRSGYVQQTRSNVMATYGMEQALDFITKGLSAKAVVSFDSRSINNMFASREFAKFVPVVDPNLKGQDGKDSVYYRPYDARLNTPLSISGGHSFSSLSNFQAYLNYTRDFKKHSVSGLVLYQQQKNIINAQLPFKLMGLASRLTYGYDDKYFFELNAGYNGSEQFAKGRRFGFFPAVSGGWVVSNEKFLASSRVLTLLKIRGSYGTVGNDRIGSRRFLYLDDIQMGGGGYSGSLGYGQTINTNLLKNEALQWEVARKGNIGVEIGLLDQLNLVVDVYKEKRDNILRNRGTVPVLNGLPNHVLPPVNIGVIDNKGYEVELNYRKSFQKDFSILSKINVNFARNKQIFADEPMLSESFAYQYRETGYAIGQSFGYVVERYFRDEEDVRNSPKQEVGGHESRPGDFKYKDLNNDGVVNERDMAPIGYSGIPEYTFGGAFNIMYKGFDLSGLFQGVTNVNRHYGGRGNYASNDVKNYVERHLQSWTPERAANGEPISYPRLTTQVSPNENANSFFIVDASYLRLKNVELGYTLPTSMVKKIGAQRVRVYTNGLNLVTWDRLPAKDFDPEISGWEAYPITRIFNLGLNVTF
jgi:TonB-linked SusC/RagA family outer membrane protein